MPKKPKQQQKTTDNVVVLTLTHSLELFLLLDGLKHGFFMLPFYNKFFHHLSNVIV